MGFASKTSSSTAPCPKGWDFPKKNSSRGSPAGFVKLMRLLGRMASGRQLLRTDSLEPRWKDAERPGAGESHGEVGEEN